MGQRLKAKYQNDLSNLKNSPEGMPSFDLSLGLLIFYFCPDAVAGDRQGMYNYK
jgi:hypothetical protein